MIAAASDQLCGALSCLVNRSFIEGKFPRLLKTARVIPIFKNGNKTDISNYRPVSLQTQISKIFEICFNKRMTSFLESHHLLSPYQFGFRAGQSTQTALTHSIETIYNSLNDKHQIAGLFFDMSRAFDSVDHDLLLKKLECLGVRGTTNDWIRSYLHDRMQQVEVSGVRSSAKLVARGTPQGSVISPTLFNVFISDLPERLHNSGTPVIYADDTNVLIWGESREQLVARAKETILIMSEWCKNNGLKINADKTIFVQFYTKNVTIDSTLLLRLEGKSVINSCVTRFLGLSLDQKLTWSSHIGGVLARLSSCAFLMKNLKGIVSSSVLRMIYFGVVQSILSYGITLWGGASEANKILVAQKKIIRCMFNIPGRMSCRSTFSARGILTFPSLYILSLVMHIKQQNMLLRRRDVHGHDTRKRDEILVPFSRLTVGQNSPMYVGSQFYNRARELMPEADALDANAFKSAFKKILIGKVYYSVDEYMSGGGLVLCR